MNDISVLGVNIKAIRESKGLSINELSRRAGVGSASISEVENGKRQTLHTTNINKIAIALGVEINDLLTCNDNLEIDTYNVCEILSLMCTKGLIKLDGITMSDRECILLENSIMLAINGLRMRRLDLAQAEIEKHPSKKNLKIIK